MIRDNTISTYAVDFETYYSKEYSITELGAAAYCRHPEFHAYMVSIYSGPEGLSYVGPVEGAPWHLLHGAYWVSHNNDFDSQVFIRLLATKKIPIEVWPKDWFCSASLCAFIGAPRGLDKAVKALFGVEVSKDPRRKAKGKRWDDMKPEQREEITHYALDDAIWCWRIWENYKAEWPENEIELHRLTNLWGQHGVYIDQEHVNKSIASLKQQNEAALEALPWIKRGQKPLSRKAIEEECKISGIPEPKTPEGKFTLSMGEENYLKWEETYAEIYPWVKAHQIYRRTGKHLASFNTIQRRIDPQGKMPYSFKYFGTHTGRWSGESGLNLQNLATRQTLQPFDVDIRKALIPAPGKKFIIADLSQIEPRILAWYTGNMELLSYLRKGVSIYEAFARQHMGYKNIAPLDKLSKTYKLAKAQVLGLGYGLGAKRFIEAAFKLAKVQDLSYRESLQTVKAFRDTNPYIVKLWRTLDNEFRAAAGGDYYIPLRTGRFLHYWNVQKRRNKEDDSYDYTAQTTKDGPRYKMWGGFLTENLIQATARDVFAEHLQLLHNSGVGRIVFHVHDEVILECEPDIKPEEVEQIMSYCPEWLEGVPIKAEAMDSAFYCK